MIRHCPRHPSRLGAGGVDYLRRQAKQNPGAFLALVGKVLPKDVREDPKHRENLSIQVVFVDPPKRPPDPMELEVERHAGNERSAQLIPRLR